MKRTHTQQEEYEYYGGNKRVLEIINNKFEEYNNEKTKLVTELTICITPNRIILRETWEEYADWEKMEKEVKQ